MRKEGMNTFFLEAIDCKAIKIWVYTHHNNCLPSNCIMPKTTYVDLLLKVFSKFSIYSIT